MSADGFVENIPLNNEMRCSIVSNSTGDILILHDQKLRSDIQWIDFDVDAKTLSLIHEDGSPQDLGIVLDAKMVSNLSNGLEVSLVRMDNDKAVSRQRVIIVIQEY
ncbi:MAG: hypothetical protein GW778_05275 [Alphaproteobacteria bacterium]|nr:hypothetical protein [Alphaproteobacteria bacterium]